MENKMNVEFFRVTCNIFALMPQHEFVMLQEIK